jgi:hypothetical protein
MNTIQAHEIVVAGEAIYRDRYRKQLEQTNRGRFIAINVGSGDAEVSDSDVDAVRAAIKKDPSNCFHLIRVGYPAAYQH